MKSWIVSLLVRFLRRHQVLLNTLLCRLADFDIILVPMKEPGAMATVRHLVSVKREKRLLQTFCQAYNLVRAVEASRKATGDIAEVGVYRGGSAKIIAGVKGDRVLHLFDTFEGLPEPSGADASHFRKGAYRPPSRGDVEEYLREFRGISFHVGFFPDTAAPVKETNFSFVHLDVDLVESTRECLSFFYPRMSRGGIIFSQDYGITPVRELIEQFFTGKPEPVIELLSTQCMVVKI